MIENFAPNLINLRKERGLSQKEFAKELGISPQTISNIENQIAYPTFTNLEKIAQYFNATPNQLFGTPREIEVEKSVYETEVYVEKAREILKAGQLIVDIQNDSDKRKLLEVMLSVTKGEMIKNSDGQPLERLVNGKYIVAENDSDIAYTGGLLQQIEHISEVYLDEVIDKIRYIKENKHLLKKY